MWARLSREHVPELPGLARTGEGAAGDQALCSLGGGPKGELLPPLVQSEVCAVLCPEQKGQARVTLFEENLQ